MHLAGDPAPFGLARLLDRSRCSASSRAVRSRSERTSSRRARTSSPQPRATTVSRIAEEDLRQPVARPRYSSGKTRLSRSRAGRADPSARRGPRMREVEQRDDRRPGRHRRDRGQPPAVAAATPTGCARRPRGGRAPTTPSAMSATFAAVPWSSQVSASAIAPMRHASTYMTGRRPSRGRNAGRGRSRRIPPGSSSRCQRGSSPRCCPVGSHSEREAYARRARATPYRSRSRTRPAAVPGDRRVSRSSWP